MRTLEQLWKGLLFGCFAVLLVGCATGPTYNDIKATLKPPAGDSGRLFIYRSSIIGSARTAEVIVDGQELGSIRVGAFRYVDCSPGRHNVMCLDKSLNVEVGKNQSTFVEITVSNHPLTLIDRIDGEKEIDGNHLAETTSPILDGCMQYVPAAPAEIPAGYAKITLRRGTDSDPPLYVVDFDVKGVKANAQWNRDADQIALLEGPRAPRALNQSQSSLNYIGVAGGMAFVINAAASEPIVPCQVIGFGPPDSTLSWCRPAGKMNLIGWTPARRSIALLQKDMEPGKHYIIDYRPFTGLLERSCDVTVTVK